MAEELIKLGGYVVQGHGSDETVLWEGNLTTIGSAMNLTEPMSNFESVKIYFNDVNDAQTNVVEVHSRANYSRISCIEQMLHPTDGIYFRGTCLNGNIASTAWSVQSSYSYVVNGNAITNFDKRTTNGQNIYVKPVKVIGIRRKPTA